MSSVDAGFQALLAVTFTVASVRLFYTALTYKCGRQLFRAIGGILSGLWALFYFHAAWGDAPIELLADLARVLQYWNVTMFVLWGFLVREDCPSGDVIERLRALLREAEDA